MADLCGGHPADVLIAVCLAARALTVPGTGEVAVLPTGRAGGKARCCPEDPGLETQRLRRAGEGGTPPCALGHACLSVVSPRGRMAQCPLDTLMEVPPDKGRTDGQSLCPSVASSLLRDSGPINIVCV